MTRIVTPDIQRLVAGHYGLPPRAIVGPCRERRVARPRQVAMWLAHRLTANSMPALGRRFGRDHTTILHGIRNIERLRHQDVAIASDLEVIARDIVALMLIRAVLVSRWGMA